MVVVSDVALMLLIAELEAAAGLTNKEYVGQTGHNLKLRYKEHKRYIRYNNHLLTRYISLTINKSTAL